MCTLYDRIQSLCKNKGVSGSRMCLDLGLSKSTLSDIKSGRKKGVSTATAQKIAAYFGVTVGYLLGEEEKQKAPAHVGERNTIRLVGRDGSVIEKVLTDEQLSAYKTMVDHLPEADDL